MGKRATLFSTGGLALLVALIIVGASAKIDGLIKSRPVLDQRTQLEQIRSAIQQQGVLSAATVGSKLALQIDLAFHSGNVTVGYLNATLDNTHLVVVAKARVWDATVLATLTFFFPTATSNEVQLQIQFNAQFDPVTVYRAVFPRTQPPSFLEGVRASEQLTVVLSTFAYNSYSAGLSVLSTSSILSSSNNDLSRALTTLNPNAMSATFTTNLFVPLFSANPTYINLQLTEQGNFPLTSSIQCSSYQLSVSVSASTSFSLSTNLQVSLKNQATPVLFSASALWKANTSASFSGSISGSWTNPFGLHWISSITNAKISFIVTSQSQADQLTIDGTATFTFAPQSQSNFHVALLGSGDHTVSVNNVIGSRSSSVSAIYSAVTKTATPEIMTGAILGGQVGFTLSSYNAGSTKKGLLIYGNNVQVGSGTALDKAVKTLASNPQTFTLSLFIPVYGGESAQFSLSATGSFALTESVTISSYSVSVTISNSVASVGLSATASVALANQPQPLTFNVATRWQEGSPVSFQGALQGTWQHPFHFGWLSSISTISLTISVSGTGASASSVQVSIAGTAALTSTPSRPFPFTINVASSGDWQFSVSNFPIESLSSFYSAVVGSSSPSVLNEARLSGQASLAIATYASGSIAQGLTVSATATLSAGTLSKAISTIKASSSQVQYRLAFFVPLLGAQGSATVSLSETGSISLTRSLQINSYAVSAVLSQSPEISLSAQLAITVAKHPQPLLVNVNAKWTEGSSSTSFAGTLANWVHPLGLRWLTLQNVNVNLVLSSSAEPQLSFSGTAVLAFESSPVNAIISYSNGDVVLSVSNIPINTLVFFYKEVVGTNPPHWMIELNTIQGTVSFTLATASSGSVKEGLTLTAHTNLLSGSLSTAVKTLIASPASITFDLNLYIPVFGPDPSAISLTLTESGSFHLSHSLSFQSFQLTLNVAPGQSTSISLSAVLSVKLSHQPQPVAFAIAGQWQEAGAVSFSGKLNGQWNNPFGASWLSITGASLQIAVQQAVVQSLSIAGSSVITFGSTSVDSSFSISTANNFVDTTFIAEAEAKWTLAQIAHSVTGKSVAVLADVIPNDVSFALILSTYAHDNIKTGLTIQTKGDITGNLAHSVRALAPNAIRTIHFAVGMNIPLFTSDPLDLAISLEVDSEIQLTRSFYYEKLGLEVDAFPLAISADSEFKATFTKNPALLFDIDGKFSSDGSVTLTGEMIGEWEEVFGIKGFSLSDIIIELGFNPAMCAVDACISDLGLGFNMKFGTKTITFDGNAAAPDFQDIFIKGSISGANGMALTFLDIVLEWNRIFPSLRIPTDSVPANWGLKDTSFYFAPKDGTFGSITYQEGFSFTGGIELLDMDLDFTVSCSEHLADYCDFSIDVHLDFHLFFRMLKREVDLLNAERALAGEQLIIFTLDSLSLTQWSAHNVARGTNPRWQIGLTVFDKKHSLDFEVPQWMMSNSFKSFFKRWIKHIF